MNFQLSYQLSIQFSQAVSQHQYALRLLPRLASGVRIHRQQLSIAGVHDQGELRDGFANQLIYGNYASAHTHFEVSYQAVVSRELVFSSDLPVDWFVLPSLLTKADQNQLALWLDVTAPLTKFEQAMHIMQEVFSRMTYLKGSTKVWHGVDRVLQQPTGVCQDYAHVMIALLRFIGIPARYVAGVAQGEGESHAWVEAWVDGWWQGFDPTHNCMVSYQDAYIPIAVGRDAADCPLNMGQFVGQAEQVLTVQTQLLVI
ncbi:MAG: transglutaminase family protein [Gammaproteobacteria bacterium]|nr:transglutaminase family protein [Gammaproteobacteria bacterium]UCG18125.1 MAG: transglutaminase family protein [Thiotrichales bacterium]